MYLGVVRCLVRAVDSGEVLQLTRACLGVEAFDVASFGHFEWGVNEDLDEFTGLHLRPNHISLGAEGRDEGGDDNETRVCHQLGHFTDAADVFHTVGFGEAQILVQPVAHIVAVEKEGVAVHPRELLLDDVRDGRLAGA